MHTYCFDFNHGQTLKSSHFQSSGAGSCLPVSFSYSDHNSGILNKWKNKCIIWPWMCKCIKENWPIKTCLLFTVQIYKWGDLSSITVTELYRKSPTGGETQSRGENLKCQFVEQVCSWSSAYLEFPAFPPLAPPPGEHSEPTTVEEEVTINQRSLGTETWVEEKTRVRHKMWVWSIVACSGPSTEMGGCRPSCEASLATYPVLGQPELSSLR